MPQHTLGVVGYIIWVLFATYFSFQWWKNFEHRLRFDKVIAVIWWSPFWDHSIHCEPKKHQMFLSYLSRNPTDSNKLWSVLSWVNLPYSNVNVFHLTWLMSLHHLWNLAFAICKWTAGTQCTAHSNHELNCYVFIGFKPILSPTRLKACYAFHCFRSTTRVASLQKHSRQILADLMILGNYGCFVILVFLFITAWAIFSARCIR